jgi:hypothetical protein
LIREVVPGRASQYEYQNSRRLSLSEVPKPVYTPIVKLSGRASQQNEEPSLSCRDRFFSAAHTMNLKIKWLCALGFLAWCLPTSAKDLQFSGYTWTVRSGHGGPGPNAWEEENVWLDQSTNLHLKLSQRDGKWSCAEITMQQRLGFGRYEFKITGPIHQFDDNVVLGLFNYPGVMARRLRLQLAVGLKPLALAPAGR